MISVFARNLSALFVRQILAKLLGLVWMGYLARVLGTTDFGNYVMLQTLRFMLAWTVDLGTAATFSRRVACDRKALPICLKASCLVRAVLGTTVAILIVAGFRWAETSKNLWIGGQLTALCLLLSALASIGDAVFAALEEMHISASANMASTSVTLFVGFGLVQSGHGLHGALVAQLAGACVLGAIYAVQFAVRDIHPGGDLSGGFLREFLWEAVRIGGLPAISVAYQRVDRLLLASYCSISAAALFHLASTALAPLQDLYLATFAAALFPAMARVRSVSSSRFHSLVRAAMGLAQGAALMAAVLVSLYSRQLISLLFGGQYAAAGPPLALLALVFPMGLTSHMLVSVLLIERRSTVPLAVSAATTAALLCGNLILIPRLGLMAPAMSILGVEILSLLTLVRLTRAIRNGLLPLDIYPWSVAACGATALLAVAARHSGLPAYAQMTAVGGAGVVIQTGILRLWVRRSHLLELLSASDPPSPHAAPVLLASGLS